MENKKMTSIARRINQSFWLKRLSDVIVFDLLLIMLIFIAFVMWRYDKLPQGEHIERMYFTADTGYNDLTFILKTEAGEYPYLVSNFADYLIMPFLILISIELLHLVFSLFGTAQIRKKLKPLNDLAIAAEKISAIPLDTSKIESLEHAIENVSPENLNVPITTGDKDLQSIEVALNNLICRIKESQKQQVRFVSDASHELRTPISVIQGYANMMDRWGKEDENVLNESIQAIKQESQHMKELVEQLLFLARGDSGRNNLSLVEFDLNEVIKEVWEESLMIDEQHIYKFLNGSKNVVNDDNIILNPPAMMVGDVAMIKQSVRIFIQNAAKYSNQGDTIVLRVYCKDDSVCYEIQDEGIGMQESDMVHIFERFYRADRARNGESGGSGLGLSIAKWIIDAHHGSVEVLSRPDFGTRFTVSFKSNRM